MVPPARNPSPEDPDETSKRLSSDESLWDETSEHGPAPAKGEAAPPPSPPRRRPLWRRALRVNLLLAGAAVALLLVGFLLGASLADSGRPAAGASTPTPAGARPTATVTSIVIQPGPPPRSCRIAAEWADKAIAYMVGNIRDDRLTKAIQEFVRNRRACQKAVG
jgi:hypothetical protein